MINKIKDPASCPNCGRTCFGILHISYFFGLRKMKKALQQASESGAERALLLFPEELERNEVVVRDMKLREQTSIQLEKLLQISPKEQT